MRSPANALAERPELAALIGECITFWSQVEAHLAILLSAIMKTGTAIASAVFLSIRNSRAQREALTAAAAIGLSGRELEMFSAIEIVYQSLDTQRADLAHGIFVVSDDLPGAILWIDSKHFTKRNVEHWDELSKATLAGLLAEDTLDEKMRDDLFVYKKDDLLALRDDIKQFWLAVFLFIVYLRLPASDIGEQEFQKLYNVPLIQRALSRLREG